MQRVNCSYHYFYSNLQCIMLGFGGVGAVSDVGNGPAFDTVRLIEAAWTRANVIPRSVAVVVGSVFATPLLGRHVELGFAIDLCTRPQSMCMSVGRLHHERPGPYSRSPGQTKETLPPSPNKIHLQNASPSARGRAAPSARFLIQSCGYIHTHETSTTVS